MSLLLISLIAAVGVAFALYTFAPDRTRRALDFVDNARQVVFGIGALLFAFVFITSGNEALIIVGFVILVYLAVYALFDVETQDVKRAYRKVRP